MKTAKQIEEILTNRFPNSISFDAKSSNSFIYTLKGGKGKQYYCDYSYRDKNWYIYTISMDSRNDFIENILETID